MNKGVPARDMTEALLQWYGPRRLAYPWRSEPPDPYHVLVSEVMLQQTQAPRVVPVFAAFVRRFPTVPALARAGRAEVLRAWAGLGYNRRALALSEAARSIVDKHGGRVPRGPNDLRALPGIGPYTAAAVASIAHGIPVAAVDTNVARVTARLCLGVQPHQAARRDVERAAAAWLDPADPGAWNQAVMDLGRSLCRPRPRCTECPLQRWCRFLRPGPSPAVPLAAKSRPRQGPFEGSLRQARGRVVRILADGGTVTLGRLVRESGLSGEIVRRAVQVLAGEGTLRVGAAARAGSPEGRVRVAD